MTVGGASSGWQTTKVHQWPKRACPICGRMVRSWTHIENCAKKVSGHGR